MKSLRDMTTRISFTGHVLFLSDWSEAYAEFLLPKDAELLADDRLSIGLADASLPLGETFLLGTRPESVGFCLVTGRLTVAASNAGSRIHRTGQDRIVSIRPRPGDVVGLGLNNLGEIYVTHNGRVVPIEIPLLLPEDFSWRHSKAGAYFNTTRTNLEMQMTEEWMFDPESAECTWENTPRIPCPILSESEAPILRIPVGLMGHLLDRHSVVDDFDDAARLKTVSRFFRHSVAACNVLWKRLYSERFLASNVKVMRPRSWHDLFMARLLRRTDSGLATIENCDVLECPGRFQLLEIIDGPTDLNRIRICQTCDKQCQRVYSLEEARKASGALVAISTLDLKMPRGYDPSMRPDFHHWDESLEEEIVPDPKFEGFTYQDDR